MDSSIKEVADVHHVLNIPDHCTRLFDQLNALRCNQSLCDAVLTSLEKSTPVHRIILTATSPYFTKCIQEQMSDGNCIYDLPSVDSDILEIIVNFIYSGKLTVSKDTVHRIKSACEQLELTHAVKACEKYILSNYVLKKTEKLHQDASVQTERTNDDLDGEPTPKKKAKFEKEVSSTRKRKVAKSSPKDIKKATKKNETVKVKIRKSRKPSAPKRRKSQDSFLENSSEKKSKENAKNLKATKVVVKKEIEYSDDLSNLNDNFNNVNNEGMSAEKLDSIEVKIECNDGDEVAWEADYNEHDGNAQDDENNYDCDTDDNYDDAVKEVGSGVANVPPKRRGRGPNKSGIKKRRVRKKFPCTMCSQSLTSNKRLVFHQYVKHGMPIDYDAFNFKMWHCEVEGCDYIADSKGNWTSHMNSRHGKSRPHICEFCGKGFKLASILAIHVNIHTRNKIYKCDDCGEEFTLQTSLRMHRKRYHMGDAPWTEMCHMCSEKFLFKADLAWHLFKEHGQPLPDNYKAHTCEVCGFATMNRQQFNMHRQRHDGIKNFICPICQKACSSKSEMTRHVSFHGEKKFKCTFDGCSYACTDTIGLDKHIKLMHTHKDFKPYACPVCQYRTGVKGNADKHIRAVHDLVVVTKHTVTLRAKYSQFESGDVITKDGHLVSTAKERKALQLIPSQTKTSANNQTQEETGDFEYSNFKKSKPPKDQHARQTMPNLGQIQPSTSADMSDNLDSSKMESIMNDLPPLNNYVYLHGREMGRPEDLRLQGVKAGLDPNSSLSVLCPPL